MKFIFDKRLLIVLLVTTNANSYEVNTHQAITKCATEEVRLNQCNKTGAENLHKFSENAHLNKIDYAEETFEKYNEKYFTYAKEGEGFKDWGIGFSSKNYQDLIEAGVVLEDSVYPHADIIAGGGDGRFNNHFYAAQFDSKSECGKIVGPITASKMLSNKALCLGYGKRTDNITWALDDSVVLGSDGFINPESRVNDYGIHDAFKYYRNSFTGEESERKTNQAKLFVSLGFMIHMIQDLHSPAHVRDGSHPLGDYLEIYGRYNGGFYLRRGALNPNNNSAILSAVKAIDTNKIMLVDNKYSSYQDFFTHEANWVSKNFFSEAHNDTDKATNNETGEGLDLDTLTDRDTIFDANNPQLAKADTFESPIPNSDTAVFGDLWNYIKTNGNVATEKGDISSNHNVVGIVEHGYFFNSERMLAVVSGKDKPDSGYSYNDYDKTPLSDTAINAIPRAVASSEAFINYFFRGRMKATLSSNEESIVIKNISDPQWVSSPELCTFKSIMKVDIFYINDQGESKILFSKQALNSDIAIGDEITIDLGNVLENISDMGDKKEIIVLLDGELGDKQGLDDYNLDARGLVVAYASFRVANADILFSFDKSGSMGSSIEQAKDSAKSILDDVIGVDNATNFIEIEAFSDNASVLLAYSTDVNATKTQISTLRSDGNTVLYDAIKLAGNNAVAHKLTNSTEKSIVILYTDGKENGSSASKQAAIDAISKQKASEIDDVFLIFVGSSDHNGKAEMLDIANKAGRDKGFITVANAADLKAAIEKILKGQ